MAPPARVWAQRAAVTVALIFIQFVFGGYSVVSSVALSSDADPAVFSFLRDLFASPCLFLAAWYFERLPRLQPEHAFTFVLLGLTGIFGNQLFYILGLNYTSPLNAALLQPGIPVFTLLLALIFKYEVLKWKTVQGWFKILGILAAVAGAVVVVALGSKEGDGSTKIILGNICLVINCMSMAIYVLLQKRVLDKYPPITITAYAYGFGTCFMGISLTGCTDADGRWTIAPTVWYALMYAALLSSVLCSGIITWANKRTSATYVTSFYPLQPFVSALLSALFLSYQITLGEILGGVLIIIGLAFVVAARAMEERTSLRPDQAPLLAPTDASSSVTINDTDGHGELTSKAA